MTSITFSEALFVDTHCHLDLYPDAGPILASAARNRVLILAVTSIPSVFFHTKRLSERFPLVLPAVGLHPEIVHSHGHEIEQMMPLLAETRYVGEVGLDYTTQDAAIRANQRDVFGRVLERCNLLGGKVLTVHSRRAAGDVISAIGKNFNGKIILHWFTGTKKEADRALDVGCYFSVNSAMIKAKSSRSIIEGIPLERILTETDGPFVKTERTPDTPTSVMGIVASLSLLYRRPEEEVRDIVICNFRSL